MTESVVDRYDRLWEAAKKRHGKCYRLAGQHVVDSDHEGIVLVHGQAAFMPSHLPQVPFDHAWVRWPNGTVWEPISQMTLTAEEWEVIAKAQWWAEQFKSQDWPVPAEKVYTREQTVRRILTEKHWGPWWGPEPKGDR